MAIRYKKVKMLIAAVLVIAIGTTAGSMSIDGKSVETMPVKSRATAHDLIVTGMIAGDVTHIVDGDTLDIDNVRIRLALVDTPERGEPGFTEAADFVKRMCPVGYGAWYDPDDGQTGGSYGRVVAEVWCGFESLNAALYHSGHGEILTHYCDKSEFAGAEWARQGGC